MSNVAIEKVGDQTEKTLPVFSESAKRIEDVRHRAFGLFERRGGELGHAVEDWLEAEREIFGGSVAEMSEHDKEYELHMTLPGFDTRKVQVTATPSEIIVHAETKSEKSTESANVVRTEFTSDDVYRRFEIPQPIDVDRTRATLDNGVLRITAAKAAAIKERPAAAGA